MLRSLATISLLSTCLTALVGCSTLSPWGGEKVVTAPLERAESQPPSLAIPASPASPAQEAAPAIEPGEPNGRPQLDAVKVADPTPASSPTGAATGGAAGPVEDNLGPPPAELTAFVRELDRIPDLDPEMRYEILGWVYQAPPEYRSQLIRQYRAMLAMRSPASRSEEGKSPASLPAPDSEAHRLPETQPVVVQAVGEAVATSGAMAMAKVAASDSDLVAALAGLIEQSRYTRGSQDDAPASASPASLAVRANSPDTSATWQDHVDAAIATYEHHQQTGRIGMENPEGEARLRMLYLIAGRRDDACRPIASLDPRMQEFWSKELFGLSTLLNSDLIADRSNRLIESKRSLSEALARLGESAPLFVRNLTFVTDVQSYGAYTPFPTYEFDPGQKVLLYAEVDNFQSKETARGHHTALRSSYEIFDSRRQKIAEHEFSTNEEYCRNPRRDFFSVCEFAMPERLYPGKYELRLTVADLNGDKAGESSIAFHIRDRSTVSRSP